MIICQGFSTLDDSRRKHGWFVAGEFKWITREDVWVGGREGIGGIGGIGMSLQAAAFNTLKFGAAGMDGGEFVRSNPNPPKQDSSYTASFRPKLRACSLRTEHSIQGRSCTNPKR